MRLNIKAIAILLSILICFSFSGVFSIAEDDAVKNNAAKDNSLTEETIQNGNQQDESKPETSEDGVQTPNDENSGHNSSSIDVNGTSVEIKGYNIEGNNYFKLRDIAAALSQTEKQFQVSYDIKRHWVMIEKNKAYEPDGTENYIPDDGSEGNIVETTSPVYVDGEKIELKAYNVDGSNYVKLRDVAILMDFALIYYADTKDVSFLTDKNYSQSEEIYPEPAPEENPGELIDTSGINADLYVMETLNDYSKYYSNLVDGYKMMISSDMIPDMSCSEFRTVLERNDLRIEIYRQDLNSVVGSFNSYVNYGNRFVNDSSVYTKVTSGYTQIAGNSAYVLEWYRPSLSRVSNDKHYYASVDLRTPDGEVLTFLFKSSKPFEKIGGVKSYISQLNTLEFVERTKAGVNVKTKTVVNPNWNKETADLYKKYFSPDKSLTWGIYEPMAPFSFTTLNNIETQVQGKFKFLIYYTGFTTDLPRLQNILENAKTEKRTVELTLQTAANSSGGGNMLMDVLDGKYDDFLKEYSSIVANSKSPVIFRLCNEMNGDWCVYSAYHTSKDTQLYVEFYKYVYSIFKQNGALENTIWVWNPNERSFPYYDWNHALCYYPGDAYVDLIGLTGYNTGTYHKDEVWRNFDDIYDAFYYQYDAWFSQPFMITEFSCSNFGGDKAQWTRDMMAKIKEYSRIKVAIWWDGCDFDSAGNIARSYFIDDNAGVIDAFRNYFLSHPVSLDEEAASDEVVNEDGSEDPNADINGEDSGESNADGNTEDDKGKENSFKTSSVSSKVISLKR